jgi:hypothetical protein
VLVSRRPRPKARKCTGKTFPREGFSIFRVRTSSQQFIYYKKNRPNGRFFLFLNFLEDLTLAGEWVELLEFELAIHLLLILAREENVPGRALYLYEIDL